MAIGRIHAKTMSDRKGFGIRRRNFASDGRLSIVQSGFYRTVWFARNSFPLQATELVMPPAPEGRRARRLFVGVALCLTAGRVVAAQQAPALRESITGIVRGADTSLIANAQITVTPAGAGATQSVPARSNADGRWSIFMPSKSPEYFVTVSAIGWVQSRITVKSSPTNAPVVVDVTLKKSSVTLATVRVTEQRRIPPPRESFIPNDVAQVEKGVLASSEVFAASDQGDL